MQARTNKIAPAVLAGALASLLAAVSAPASTNLWLSATNGNWGDATNWSRGLPAVTDSIYISNGGSKTVTLGPPTPTNSMTVSNLTLAADVWMAVATNGAPAARDYHTAVWTGTEMIIWGGNNEIKNFNDGARYNPASNIWTATATNGAPAARNAHTAVWTGTEMIIWGGYGNTDLNDGARYNPASDTWTAVSTNGAPAARDSHTAVWTGAEMIVWGGTTNGDSYFVVNDGGRYDPASDTWTPITTNITTNGPPGARLNHSAVWTGSEMLVWGGVDGGTLLNDGARYNPASASWTAIPANGAPSSRDFHTAVWTGSEMLVWGGANFNNYLNDGAGYSPASNIWTAIAANGAPAARASHAAVWTGSEMIVWGGDNATALNDGGRYNAASNIWIAIATNGAPSARELATAVWSGTEMIIWGGFNSTSFPNFPNDAGRYDPVGAPNILDLTSGSTNPPLQVLNNLSLEAGGSLVVDSNSLLQVDGLTAIGDPGHPGASGVGALTINSGSATVADIVVGDASANPYGFLNLNGGTLLVQGLLTLGNFDYSTGIVSMTSGTLVCTNYSIVVGGNGNGIFVQSGGTSRASVVQMGLSNSGSASFTLSNSTLLCSSSLQVSAGGSPSRFYMQNANLAVTNAGATAYLEVENNGAFILESGLLQADSLQLIGANASFTNIAGIIQLTTAGQVTNGSLALLGGTNTFPAGLSVEGPLGPTVTVAGSVVNILSNLTLAGLAGSSATLNISSGAKLVATNGLVSAGSAGSAQITVSNASFNAATLNLGSSAGGLGSLTVQSNAVVNVSSNVTVVSGSLSSTSSIVLSGGSFLATNGLIRVGPSGNGQLLITGGNHTIRQLRLGSTNGAGTGSLVMTGGYLKILGNGAGPGAGLDANAVVVFGADLDGSGTTITIGDYNSAHFFLAGSITNFAQCAVMEVGVTPGYTGTYMQTNGTMIVNTNLIVGDDCADGANGALGFVTMYGGAMYVTNASQTAVLEVRNGLFQLNAGATLVVDTLIISNSCGRFFNNGGTILARNLQLDPYMDADGDGMLNWQEALAGTDPLDPRSVFEMTGGVITNNSKHQLVNVRVDWTTVGGHRYVVQTNGDLSRGSFSNLSGVISVSGTNAGTTNYLHVGGATNGARFYRILLAP